MDSSCGPDDYQHTSTTVKLQKRLAPAVTLIGLFLASCASSPKDALLVPSRETHGYLSLLSPAVIGLFMQMDTLDSVGYTAWRKARLEDLVDVIRVPVDFTAHLPEGGTERQSGVIYLPALRQGTPRAVTWVVFLKGSEFLRDAVPSRGKAVETPLMELLAGMGFAVWAPDYAGMGNGAGVQEYGVPASLAASALDGLAAARTWLSGAGARGEEKSSETGRYAIIGYSEGGVAALAALQAATRGLIPVPGLTLMAAYPMAALLNLCTGPDMGPEYEIFFAIGWARAYPAKVRLQDILLPRIIEKVVPLFDGKHSGDDINNAIAFTVGKPLADVQAGDIYTPEYLQALARNPGSVPYYQVRIAHALDRWMPPVEIPIVLAATPEDTVISFSQIEDYYDRVKEHDPATDITLIRLAAGTHALGAVEGFLYAIRDLDRREAGCRPDQVDSLR